MIAHSTSPSTHIKIPTYKSSSIKISAREYEVLYLIADELTSQEIADRLYISRHTAISHRKHLMEKLQVKNTAGLVRRAFELGLLAIPVIEAI